MACGCCGRWAEVSVRVARVAAALACRQGEIARLKEADAGANGIRIAPAKDKPKGKRGRPKGRPVNKTYGPEDIGPREIANCAKRPECGKSDMLPDITDSHDRVAARAIIKM